MHVFGERVLTNIEREATIITDKFGSYDMVEKFFAQHERVNHSIGNHAVGGLSAYSIESFWAVLRRNLHEIYHNVNEKYLQMCIDEFCFHPNNRSTINLFDNLLERTALRKSELELFV